MSFSSLSLPSIDWNGCPSKPFNGELVETWMISLYLIASCALLLAVAIFIPGCSPFFLSLGLRRLASFGFVSGGWRVRSSISFVRCKLASPAGVKLHQRQLRREEAWLAVVDLTLVQKSSFACRVGGWR